MSLLRRTAVRLAARPLRYGIAGAAVLLAAGGTAAATGWINGSSIEPGTLSGVAIRNHSITGRDIQYGAIGSLAIRNHAVEAVDLSAAASEALRGPTGSRGARGAIGPKGPAGRRGPAGTPGADAAASYAYTYNTSPQTIADASAMTFDSNGAMSSDFAHATGSAAITVTTTGTYRIDFSVLSGTGNNFGVDVNNVLVPGSSYQGPAAGQNNGSVIVPLHAGDVLTLVNNTGGPVGLMSGGGTTNASMTVTSVG
jgi:hypothetical protein